LLKKLRKLKLTTANIDQETLHNCLINQNKLETLCIAFNRLQDVDHSVFLNQLQPLETLKKLQLSYLTLSEPIVSVVQIMKNLTYLNVSNTKGITIATLFALPKQSQITTIVTPRNTKLAFADVKSKLTAQLFAGRFQFQVLSTSKIPYTYNCDGMAMPNIPYFKISTGGIPILMISRMEKASNSLYEGNIYEAVLDNIKETFLGRFQVQQNKFILASVKYPKEIAVTKPNVGASCIIQLGSMTLQKDFIMSASWTMNIDKGDCIELGLALVLSAIDSKF